MILTDMTWPQVDALDRNTPVVIPVAAMEQHGHHMPLFTDSMLLGEIVRRSAEAMSAKALFAPLMWLGNSHHHMDFPGTISAEPRVYLDLLAGLLDNFVQHGFRRFLIFNGHGGNDVPGKQAIYEARQKYRDRTGYLFLFSTYWMLADKPEQCHPDLVQERMGHACEWETSMMLKLNPQLVGDYKSAPIVEFGTPFTPAARGWVMPDVSKVGHIGNAQVATAEKGEALFAAFSSGLNRFLERMIAWDGESWNG